MTSSTNCICSSQNTDRQLQRLAAQRSLYGRAKLCFGLHAVLSIIVASALALGAIYYSPLKPVAALWGLGLTALDFFLFAPLQKKLRESAALIQEAFDCEVLQLPWQSLVAGKQVDHELILEWAARYSRDESHMKLLRDWYPTEVCCMPLFLGRIVCQRINSWWDAKQRRRYASFLLGGVTTLIVGLVLTAIVQGATVVDLIVSAVVPLSAAVWLAFRNHRENSEAAMRLDRLKDHATELWSRALKGAAETELAAASRTLQDELFNHRKRNVPVFDWVYHLLRGSHEQQMQLSAADMLRDFEASRQGMKSS